MTTAIQLDHVTAKYREHPVLQDISLTINSGEMVGILGPNGAGKSTLFNIVSGLLTPATGTVKLFNADLRQMPPRERAKAIAVVPQELDIPVPYTVEEIVMMGRTVSMGRFAKPTSQDRQAVERAMVYTDVADIRHRHLNELSGGERQRAIVAMVLAQEPRIILMDEATSHLDINHRLEIMQLVERLNRESGVTVLMISHDLQMAAEFSRRLIVLQHGNIVADGIPSMVLTEETLRRVYNCDVRVSQDPQTGGLSILAAPRLPAAAAGKGIQIHAVAGGGCGEATLRRLALCGYTLSCGVVSQGDMDAEIGAVLGAKLALEKPFSPISREALQVAQDLAFKADALVLTPIPFGTGNLPNLELLESALTAGKPVFIASGIGNRDYTPTRQAEKWVQTLIDRGAKPYQDVAELLTLLPAKSG
ncbi:MAG: ATP-binding cassette domain-containing protein [bacterium]|jgi:iron complex transport system ATP-binding protein